MPFLSAETLLTPIRFCTGARMHQIERISFEPLSVVVGSDGFRLGCCSQSSARMDFVRAVARSHRLGWMDGKTERPTKNEEDQMLLRSSSVDTFWRRLFAASLPATSEWWSWRGSNPRPNREHLRFLHAYSGLHCRVTPRPGPPSGTLASKVSPAQRGIR